MELESLEMGALGGHCDSGLGRVEKEKERRRRIGY
jgi:hypothetical protein